MKVAKVVATFENLEGVTISQEAEASTVRSAISRALAAVLKAPELKRKRLTVMNLSVDLSNKE